MAFIVKVEGAESFEIAKECVRSVKMTTDIPLDSLFQKSASNYCCIRSLIDKITPQGFYYAE